MVQFCVSPTKKVVDVKTSDLIWIAPRTSNAPSPACICINFSTRLFLMKKQDHIGTKIFSWESLMRYYLSEENIPRSYLLNAENLKENLR